MSELAKLPPLFNFSLFCLDHEEPTSEITHREHGSSLID